MYGSLNTPNALGQFIIPARTRMPKRFVLVVLCVVGAITGLFGAYLALKGFYHFRYEKTTKISTVSETTRIVSTTVYRVRDIIMCNVVIGLAAVLAGFVTFSLAYYYDDMYYRRVVQGEVVDKNVSSHFHSTTVNFFIVILGYTQEGKMKKGKQSVSMWFWDSAEVGEFVNFGSR